MAKFHEQLHVPDDIERNGAPINTHTGPTEHNHIIFIKNPARRTQRRQANLDKSIANRFAENYIINAAYDAIERPYFNRCEPAINGDHTSSTRCLSGTIMLYKSHQSTDQNVYYFIENKNYFLKMSDIRCFECFANNISVAANLLWTYFNSDYMSITLRFYSEYKRNGTIF